MAASPDQPRVVRPARPYDRRAPRRRSARSRPETILGRRDVAIVPWVAISVAGVMVAISTWLRGPSGEVDLPVVAGALVVALLTGAMASIQDTAIGLRYRGALPIYLSGATLLLGILAAIAWHAQGVANVYFGLSALLAAYLGLVLPPVWARRALVVMLLVAGGLDVVRPAPGVDAVIPIALIVTGWLVGAVGYIGHERAAEVAGALSRYDALTATLNRRGFLDQLERTLRQQIQPSKPLALLVIDLDGFKDVNDTLGHPAGDELLGWVGRSMATALPPEAEVGRLGGDEFAVLLPTSGAIEAHAIAVGLRAALAERIGASIGIATSETRAVNADDLLRVADAAMYRCKRDPARELQSLVANSVGKTGERRRRRRRSNARALSYAAIRASGEAPRPLALGAMTGTTFALGCIVTAATGAVVVGGVILGDGTGFYNDALRYLGIPWVLWMLGLAAFTVGKSELAGRDFEIAYCSAVIGLPVGIGGAMLTHGGLTAPIGAALFLKVLFDASTMPRRRALITLGVVFAEWCAVIALGPASALWVIPFHLGMFGASFALGLIGQRAYLDITQHALSLAHTDPLTGLKNRSGFEEEALGLLAAADEADRQLAVLALDLDDFKSVNDTMGHSAGDRLLRDVARVLTATFDDALVVGRLGGDEFVVVTPVDGPIEAQERAHTLEGALAVVAGASVGHAAFPHDGADLAALMLAADRRSYGVKRARRATRERTAA